MKRVLLLAGSGEGRELARLLAAEPGIEAVASLAGATRVPQKLDLPTRVGGFGGAGPFADYLRQENFDAVIDATHPFADRISQRSATVCAQMQMPYLQVLRPEWQAQPGDNWTLLDDESEAANHIAAGSVVFLATGTKTLRKFANLKDCKVFCRRIDAPRNPFLFSGGEYIVSRPPFSVEEEIAHFRALAVDWLVVKNSGGTPSRSKLDAARILGLRVALIRRPPQPDAPWVATPKQAIDWLRGLA